MEKIIRRKIRSGSLRDVFSVINGMEDTTNVLVLVIRRNHVGIFNAALTRAKEVPPECIQHLLDKPEMLRAALARGMDPNVKINGITAVEMAARKHNYGALKEILALDDVVVSRYVIGKVKNHADLYMLALKHTKVRKLDVIYALQIRSTPLLQLCLAKMKGDVPNLQRLAINDDEDDKMEKEGCGNEEDEEKEEDPEELKRWAVLVEEKLQCPILLRPTAEPVRAPSGHIYDQSSIYDWVATNATNPMTRQPLNKDDLVMVGATILGPELLKGI